ncbi:DNA repair protein RecN [Dokdonia pacifica]|uniref:DNA repair protein RecN n=1 Tax=Dokdonia pacifica TaxID=1627892 RepID=A0A238ZK52_9FLAO|nr:DNA repair protein RecN [Dokdonia pacifica]GGG06886.1 DNA repair protein RecN [Dokdonia pacifica]SNR83441.1 DNA replication and repair protein RecN [Dokdonia pacifica]
MLTSLSIKNYALIEEAQLAMQDGFTVITGETGAGKSILLGALGLITGKRADSSSMGDMTSKCIIEGIFEVAGYQLQSFFKKNDLDYEEATIIRREILPSGKSRAFINDTPVTLAQLGALGERLVDIHSQHKTLDVTNNEYQFEVLDTFANTLILRKKYQDQYTVWKNKLAQLQQVQEKKQRAQLEFDYQSFLFNELDEAKLIEGEFEQLETALKTLSHAEEIQENLATAQQKLGQDDVGILDQLSEARSALSRISGFGEEYETLYNRLHSVFIEVDDLSQELADLASGVDADPLTLEKTNTRIQLLYNLMKKHQVDSVTQLIEVRERLDAELFEVQNVDDQIAAIEKEIAFAKAEAQKIAAQLHEKRSKAIPKLKASIEKILVELGMPNAQLHIEVTRLQDLMTNGQDALAFLFSANKGMDVKPLGKGASGGELSRVMLAIKAVLSRHKKLPTLIFDEIDTGVSGEVAVKMGTILKDMGHTMQLISITHLPQIAGQGTSHFKVFKTDQAEKTKTQIVHLSPDDRIVEIAAMLGGNNQTTAALEHARNLLN